MKAVILGLLIAGWGTCVACGLTAMLRYELTPSPERDERQYWPASTALTLDPERPTLVAFFHPHCPCSRASMTELAAVASQSRDAVTLKIVFAIPAEEASWEETFLIQAARQLPDAVVSFDPGGVEAERFHARASGEMLLYDAQGDLLFRGGITASRGHEGDNVGRTELTRAIRLGSPQAWAGPVYGCPLVTSERS